MFTDKSLLKLVADVAYKAAVIISLGSAATVAYLYNEYFDFPRSPDYKIGRVVPYEVKGFVVYLTPTQHETIHWATWILFVSTVVALAGLFIAGPSKRRSKPNIGS